MTGCDGRNPSDSHHMAVARRICHGAPRQTLFVLRLCRPWPWQKMGAQCTTKHCIKLKGNVHHFLTPPNIGMPHFTDDPLWQMLWLCFSLFLLLLSLCLLNRRMATEQGSRGGNITDVFLVFMCVCIFFLSTMPSAICLWRILALCNLQH